MVRVLTFGTFDGIHDGHRAMLKEAKKLGSWLIVAVSPDIVVDTLKATVVRSHNSGKRIDLVKNERIADQVVLADEKIGSWKILKKYKPDIIALGYDQDELKQSLDTHFENIEKRPTIVTLTAHKPETHHNKFKRR